MPRSRLLATHVVFWGLFLTVAIGYESFCDAGGVLTLAEFTKQFTRLYTYEEYGRVIFTFYLSLWIFTHWFQPKRLPLIFLQIFLLGLFDAVLAFVLDRYALGPLTGHFYIRPRLTLARFLGSDISSSWLFVMMAFILKHLSDYYRGEALLHEKNAIELAYLKSQLNPHFLFNSMNNLYGLALTEPDRTPDAILKLAELMRYMLYESNETHVALTREVDYLHSYIALEKLRHEGEVHVEFTVEGPVSGREIAPLLLISFVENAFKHGNVHNPAQPIRLHLTAGPADLTFTAHNQIVPKNKDQVGGVGLASVRRRLALLYPGRHRLAITGDAHTFSCMLTLADAGPPPRPAAAPASTRLRMPLDYAAPAPL